ncbi:acyl carrier protein [Streptomyces sp. PTM05]|uniref:Acyl carrier protein n=1 Tax=Streptantibioticus parmotrematis TaxID=2873249 RepID=A0ABS7R0F9_9ACTN|nr:phosphopantetheine-binding protein [Streptantibioticus parmotrematis]MBY8888953.1 acyl carrier protein [Streptantibioticus parmotrematis]
MSREIAAGHVKAALEAALNKELPQLRDEDRLFETLGLDSVAIIQVLFVLEDRTGLEVETEDLVPAVFSSVGSVTDFVAAKLEEQSATAG